jgi:hypothetical protein
LWSLSPILEESFILGSLFIDPSLIANYYLSFPSQELKTLKYFRELEVEVSLWLLSAGMGLRPRSVVSCHCSLSVGTEMVMDDPGGPP